MYGRDAKWREWDEECWQQIVGRTLGEEGEGEEWMKALEMTRGEGRSKVEEGGTKN